MVRRIVVFLTVASVCSMLALPFSSGAQAATPGHHAAPGLLRQLEGSCWGCLHGLLHRAARGTAHRQPAQRRTVHRTRRHSRVTRPQRVVHPHAITVHRQVRRTPVNLSGWGTRVLRGSMISRSVVRMTAAFSVGHAESIDWNLPRPTSVWLNGFRQVVQAVHFHFSVKPASWIDTTVDGHPVRRFHWDNPPADTVINVVEKLRVLTQSSLSPFASSARYPLHSVPADVQPYLTMTPLVRLPGSAAAVTRSLARGTMREQRVVEAVANWVASNIHYAYGASNPPASAADVMRYHEAICTGYANVTAGMLRSLGIPTQVVFGLVTGKPLDLQGNGSAIGWGVGRSSAELHAWLNVYFPDAGWVPLDPELEKFFIDTRHVAFETNPDAGATNIGTWSAQAAPGQSPVGRILSNGSVAIAPADGISSQVAVQIQDRLNIQVDANLPDVRHAVLFSR